MQACVIGGGSWGTGLTVLLRAAGVPGVQWYVRDSEQALAINRDGRNPRAFPQHTLPDSVVATAELSEALDGCAVVYLVVPAAGLRELLQEHRAAWELWQDVQTSRGDTPVGPTVVNCSKGLLVGPTERSDMWLADALPRAALVHLSGPNLAAEIVAGKPAAAVAASMSAEAAQRVQAQLSSAQFRVYTGSDIVGVEVAGFYKNIIAIAAGLADGLELGANARAVLVTRGLAELGRLVAHFGGRPDTLHGLAGLGDLLVTCSSPLSRNFQVGLRLARGQRLQQIEAEMDETAEGVNTSRVLWELLGDANVELPIAQQVRRILHEGADPRESLAQLMQRPLKPE